MSNLKPGRNNMIRALAKWFRRVFRDEQYRKNLNFFRSISIFSGMSNRQLGRLIQETQKRNYHAGEKLFSEGQVGRAMFVIESGRVELVKTNGKSKVSLGILGPGQVFGEMALLENRPRTASAHVTEDGTIHLLYTASIETLMGHYPEIGVKLLRNLAILLSALLRKTNDQIYKESGSQ